MCVENKLKKCKKKHRFKMVNAVLMLGYKSYSFVVNNTRYNNDERQYIILDFGYGYIVVWQKRFFFPIFSFSELTECNIIIIF